MLLAYWLGALRKRLGHVASYRRRLRRWQNPSGRASQAAEVLEDRTLLSAPVAANDFYVVDVDTTLNASSPGVLGNDSDADGDPLTAALSNAPSGGTVTLNLDGP